MGFYQRFLDATAPADRFYIGTLGPTGIAPLSASSTPIKKGVLIQGLTGTSYVGNSGMTTGTAFVLTASTGVAPDVFVAVDNVNKVQIATNGIVRYVAI